MNNLKFKLAQWLLHSDGFEFVAIKNRGSEAWIKGDQKLLRYVDTLGYFRNSKPVKSEL